MAWREEEVEKGEKRENRELSTRVCGQYPFNRCIVSY